MLGRLIAWLVRKDDERNRRASEAFWRKVGPPPRPREQLRLIHGGKP